MAQILIKELQMIFQTSDVSICNGNIKDLIGSLEHQPYALNFIFKLFHVFVVVANIESLKYSL